MAHFIGWIHRVVDTAQPIGEDTPSLKVLNFLDDCALCQCTRERAQFERRETALFVTIPNGRELFERLTLNRKPMTVPTRDIVNGL